MINSKIFYIAFLFLFINCVNKKQIEVTKSYIDNDYWQEYNHFITIQKLKLVDSTRVKNSDVEKISKNTTFLEVDSSFQFHTTKVNYQKSKRVYFNKYNGFYWHEGAFILGEITQPYLGEKYKTVGDLEYNTWYKFSHLKDASLYFFVYAYIDSIGEVHQFSQGLTNY